jgi:FMN phosphatase YigB (HAD superfamily)
MPAVSVATRPGAPREEVVFLLDVDNTLLDNDAVIADLGHHLEEQLGAANAAEYWSVFERLRDELGYVDYLGALQRYRNAIDHRGDSDHRLLQISSFLIDYPFATRLYPRALDVIARLAALGTTVILSDGDVVFQPRKVLRSGLWAAVEGRVLIYVHKEARLDDVQRLYPATRYVMVDDKLRLLTAMKAAMGDRLVTVFPRQGHYALDAATVARYPAADFGVGSIAELLTLDFGALLGAPSLETS